MQFGDHPGDLVKRFGILVGIGEKTGEVADGQASIDGRQRTGDADRRIHHPVDKPGTGVGEGGIELCQPAAVIKPLVDLLKLLLRAFLVAERLDHPLPADHLFDESGHFAACSALLPKFFKRMLGDERGDKEGKRSNHHHDKGNRDIE